MKPIYLRNKQCIQLYLYSKGEEVATPYFLYEVYRDSMPHGIVRHRTGNPSKWLWERKAMIEETYRLQIERGKREYENNIKSMYEWEKK